MFICIVWFVVSNIHCLLKVGMTFNFVDRLHTVLKLYIGNKFGLMVIPCIQDAHAVGILHYGGSQDAQFEIFQYFSFYVLTLHSNCWKLLLFILEHLTYRHIYDKCQLLQTCINKTQNSLEWASWSTLPYIVFAV